MTRLLGKFLALTEPYIQQAKRQQTYCGTLVGLGAGGTAVLFPLTLGMTQYGLLDLVISY